ncbi:DNA helicase [Ureibacillus sp. Re31]|uniref:DNA 5'-3' helicase n=1 Tax=Ureibacillus galli TaxID=2762222 RepID=A0ABR8XG14_9BACL|nr:replicative DNA helicase [Ureibacillus galli]MBD8028180.1 DNA helicase [Ureibacillus galli]
MLNEEVILGTILKAPHLLMDTDLKTDYFQQTEHKNLLNAMKKLSREGQAIDLVALITKFPPERFGGVGKLNQMLNMANETKFDDYVNLLIDQWREREKLNILEIAKIDNWNLERITNELNSLVSNNTNDHSTIKELVTAVAEDPWTPKEKETGINTGLGTLQTVTNGWQNGDLIIAAGRPSMGKTDAMLHFAKMAGWNGAIPVIFSLEMKDEKLRDRLIASTGNYNRNKMKNLYERLTDKQKETWMTTLGRVSETNIEIFDKSGQTLSEIRMKVRKVKNQNPRKQLIVLIDYLTLIKPTDDHRGNMHLAVSDISKGLKAIAKDFDCPVICLAQLSRSVEQRKDKRPMLSDLRESGSIEEDADVVVFFYRDAYYTKKADDDSMEMIIAKNREGEVGTIYAKYNKYTGAISDI